MTIDDVKHDGRIHLYLAIFSFFFFYTYDAFHFRQKLGASTD